MPSIDLSDPKQNPGHWDNLTEEQRQEKLDKMAEGRKKRQAEDKLLKDTIKRMKLWRMNKGEFDDFVEDLESVDESNPNLQVALVAAMYKEAIQYGSVPAATWIRDTGGEKPVDEVKNHGALPVFIKEDLD